MVLRGHWCNPLNRFPNIGWLEELMAVIIHLKNVAIPGGCIPPHFQKLGRTTRRPLTKEGVTIHGGEIMRTLETQLTPFGNA